MIVEIPFSIQDLEYCKKIFVTNYNRKPQILVTHEGEFCIHAGDAGHLKWDVDDLDEIYDFKNLKLLRAEHRHDSSDHFYLRLETANENVFGLLENYSLLNYPEIVGMIYFYDEDERVSGFEIEIHLKDGYTYYQKYLKSERWKKLRAKLFKERGFHCELCSIKKNLHIHHLTYENLGNEKDEDVLILCAACHKKAHS